MQACIALCQGGASLAKEERKIVEEAFKQGVEGGGMRMGGQRKVFGSM